MSELKTTYGNRKDGDLLPAETWNGLVAMLDDISTKISARIDSLDASIKTVSDELTALSRKIDDVSGKSNATADRVTFLYGLNYRLTLQTGKARNPVGSPALILARLMDLSGTPVKFDIAAQRPWIDFITTWGKFTPAPGYEAMSKGGVGDRSISVRVDAAGAARVHLTAEQIEDIPSEHQLQIHQVLQSKIATEGKTIGDRIMEAATPLELKDAGVFRAISNYYENSTGGIRAFADSYFLKNSVRLTNQAQRNILPQWKDYLATVFAFAKDDSDATTADSSRGNSSLQVTFRDWVHPWIHHGFLSEIDATKLTFKDRITAKVSADQMASSKLIKDEVASFLHDTGVLGRQRNFKAMREVFNSFTVQGKSYVPALAISMRDAVILQQSLDLTSGAIGGESGLPLVFNTFTGTSVDSYAAAEGVKSDLQKKLDTLEGKVTDVHLKVNKVDTDFSAIKIRVDKHEVHFAEMPNIHTKISTIQNQFSVLQNLKVLDVPVDIERIKRDINELKIRK